MWVEGETHVRADDVAAMSTGRVGAMHVVTVRASDGTERTYRSPDAKLVEVLGSVTRPSAIGDHRG